MGLWEILVLAFVLGIDAFSVALAIGVGNCTLRQNLRLSFHFGLFQFLMPVIGWLIGRNVMSFVQEYDHWVAFAILFLIGAKMIYESLHHRSEGSKKGDQTRGFHLIALSIAVSIDALGAGVSMGILDVSILYPITIIGITTAGMTFTGAKLGSIISTAIGDRMPAFGGVILIILSIKMLLTI